jgi:ankyrin repeat protein
VNCRDLDGRHSTPLHFAAGYNRVAVVEFLLKNGADVHAKDKGWVIFTTTWDSFAYNSSIAEDWFLYTMHAPMDIMK